jgi:hypothetical protein
MPLAASQSMMWVSALNCHRSLFGRMLRIGRSREEWLTPLPSPCRS